MGKKKESWRSFLSFFLLCAHRIFALENKFKGR